MQQLKTITKKTTTKVKSVHMDTLYKVIENCYERLEVVEADCTSASYFLNSANTVSYTHLTLPTSDLV